MKKKLERLSIFKNKNTNEKKDEKNLIPVEDKKLAKQAKKEEMAKIMEKRMGENGVIGYRGFD